MAKCVSIISSRLGVLIRLLINKVNTVMFPMDDITIRILLVDMELIVNCLLLLINKFITCIQLF